MEFTAPCFSGECGFCSECCKSDFKDNNNPKNNNDKNNESLQRAKDLNKFIDKQRLEDEKDHYNKFKGSDLIENNNKISKTA